MKLTKHQKKVLKGLVREAVILRDGRICLKCGSEEIQMSHIYPVGRCKGMEYLSLNLKPLCWHHHFTWWHKHPKEAWEWIEKTLPKERLDRLLLYSQASKLCSDYKMIKLYLEQEIKELT